MPQKPNGELPAIGIDLGTSSTAAAIEIDGQVRLMQDRNGRTLFPSVAAYLPDGRVLTGIAAKNRAAISPMTTVTSIKRLIGRDMEEITRYGFQKRYAIPIIEDRSGAVKLKIGIRQVTPVEVAAEILTRVKDVASSDLGRLANRAVITVPASFRHSQREATVDAATAAGIETLRLLNEPTAAALAYGQRSDTEETLLVYDLGGGTFDVTILDRDRNFYEVRATAGRPFLGGDDFDFQLASQMIETLRTEHGVDVNDEVRYKLLPAAERIKVELTDAEFTNAGISTQWLGSTKNETIDIGITRGEFESIIRPNVAETLDAVGEVIHAARKRLEDIDRVLLVGGSTRVPLVRQMVTEYFGREPEQIIAPELAVARGAAHYAALLTGKRTQKRSLPPETKLVDVVPAALSVETVAGLCETVVETNARLPAKRTRVFTTAADGQTEARIRIFQGASRKAIENELLGEVVLDGLPADVRGNIRIRLTFEVNPNGILEVEARESGTNRSCDARLLIGRTSAKNSRDIE